MSIRLKKDILDGPWATDSLKKRLFVQLHGDLLRFVVGDELRVSLDGREYRDEDMRRLEDAYEIWEIKSKDKPQVRVFGRFAQPDTFIGTHWQWRDNINWAKEKRKCRKIWDLIFPLTTPWTGDEVNDYISSDAYDTNIYH